MTGPTGPTGAAGSLDDLSDVLVTGVTGGQVLAFNGNENALRWQNTTFGLDNLAGVAIAGSPSDGQLLGFNGAAGVMEWQNLNRATLDFVVLTTENPADPRFSIYRDSSLTSGAHLSIEDIPANTIPLIKLPNASGTIALQNQFTVTSVIGTDFAVPADTFGEGFATCPAGSKPVGVGISAFPPVTVQDMRVISATQVRVRVWRATTAATNANAVAYCMSMG